MMAGKTDWFAKLQSVMVIVVACVYLVANFIFWNLNSPALKANSTTIYNIFIYSMLVAFLVNINNIKIRSFFRDNRFLFVLAVILLFNSFFIPLGGRSREFVYTILGVFLLTTIIGRLTYRSLIDYGLKILLGLFVVYMLLGVIGAVFQLESFFGWFPNNLTDNYRYSSILDNPNSLGEYSFVGFFIAAFYFVKTPNNKTRLLCGLIIALSAASLLVSLSRAALVMVGATVGYLLFSMKHLDKQLKLILKLGIIAVVVGLICGFIIAPRFMITFFRLDQGLTGRDEIWRYLVEGIKEHWLFGVGYNNSQLYISIAFPGQTSSAHNMYLGFLYEAGIIAFIVLLAFMVLLIIRNIILIKQDSKIRLYLIMINAFYIGFFVAQFFEFTFMKISAINTFMFFIFGINQALVYQAKKDGDIKLRVVHMISGLANGGAEAMLYKIVKHTDKTKYQASVVSMDTRGFYGDLIEGFEIPVIALRLKEPIAFIKILPKFISLVFFADVLQTWLYHANLFGLFTGKLLGVDKIIWGVRQANVSYDVNPRLAMHIARVCASLSLFVYRILSNSDETTNTHQKLGYLKRKFVTIYNGFEMNEDYLDQKLLTSMRAELAQDNDLLIINVARWDPQKDHRTLFQAVRLLKKSESKMKIRLILLGMNIDQSNDELVSLLRENEIYDDTILLGVRHDVLQLMAISDIFVLSSLGEGFPNVLGEAMSVGTLVVATDVGDCKAIIGDAGLCVPPKNAELLFEAIEKLISLPEIKKDELRQKAMNRIKNTYDIKVITRKYEELYGE
ncbi:MAG: glycosyltransferase [Candidatus Izemoplasmatales bacterium]|jgi:glycosyltransferase involved in cell wall biosynthesis/O-antigen ligase